MALDAALIANPTFPLTRQEALARLEAFAPFAGAAYARFRNFDRGSGLHDHVSRLSPALRRRLVTEEEVVGAVLGLHGPVAAEKFISEVFWRTYWKGWLEHRPAVWFSWLDAVARAERHIDVDNDMADRYRRATAGQTGIDCFDAWVTELGETGYLHNWARMQFASIWIFTLGLPWELGASFMYTRLLDADPASNTLSWRWVAGLHTIGKTYLANAERIRVMTDGRFDPKGLAIRAFPIMDSVFELRPAPPRHRTPPGPAKSSALLLTLEDLSLETIPSLNTVNLAAIAVLDSDNPSDRIALDDALQRCRTRWPLAAVLGSLKNAKDLETMASMGIRQLVTGYAPTGPTATRLADLQVKADAFGITLAEHLRGWDRRAWPHCTKGFFGLKEKMNMLIDRMEDAA